MFVRYFKAAPLGIAVTFSLLYAMQSLIEQSAGPAPTTIERFDGIFVRAKQREIINPRETTPDPIDAPEPLPAPLPREGYVGENAGLRIAFPAAPVMHSPKTIQLQANGVFVNVLKVSPTYPVAAARKGLEGWVIVKFDVSALGVVENITIVESSSTLFNKSAVAAVARFRYKPRVVDGVAQPVFGLMNKFIYELED